MILKRLKSFLSFKSLSHNPTLLNTMESTECTQCYWNTVLDCMKLFRLGGIQY